MIFPAKFKYKAMELKVVKDELAKLQSDFRLFKNGAGLPKAEGTLSHLLFINSVQISSVK